MVSLLSYCLPDEVNRIAALGSDTPAAQVPLFSVIEGGKDSKPAQAEVRRLVNSRDDHRPVYLTTQGLRVGKSGGGLQVKDRETLVQEIRLGVICQLNFMGNIQVTTQAIQSLCEAEVPVCYFSQGGWFYGITSGLFTKMCSTANAICFSRSSLVLPKTRLLQQLKEIRLYFGAFDGMIKAEPGEEKLAPS